MIETGRGGGLETRTEAGLGGERSTDRSVLSPNKSICVPSKELWSFSTVTAHDLYRRVHREVQGDAWVKETAWSVMKRSVTTSLQRLLLNGTAPRTSHTRHDGASDN